MRNETGTQSVTHTHAIPIHSHARDTIKHHTNIYLAQNSSSPPKHDDPTKIDAYRCAIGS